MEIYERLLQREAEGRPIRVGLVGCGNLVGFVHLFDNFDLLPNRLPNPVSRAGLSAARNRVFRRHTSTGVSPGYFDRHTITHHLGRGGSIETTLCLERGRAGSAWLYPRQLQA